MLKILLLATVTATGGCRTVYYDTLEKFGVHKRDILTDRVEEAQSSQEAAKEQFQSALERFREVLRVEDTPLASKYAKLNAAYERSRSRAQEVTDRIDAVETVADDLFAEWNTELKDYANRDLRRVSEERYRETHDRYGELMRVMRQAEARMQPVLKVLSDHVLFLKHNLNAQAIRTLDQELHTVESDIDALIADMEASIRKAQTFIDEMRQ